MVRTPVADGVGSELSSERLEHRPQLESQAYLEAESLVANDLDLVNMIERVAQVGLPSSLKESITCYVCVQQLSGTL
jgi:hypothetical protein